MRTTKTAAAIARTSNAAPKPRVKCPFDGCEFTYAMGILGWDKHLATHDEFHPEVRDPLARRVLFHQEYPAFFAQRRTPVPAASPTNGLLQSLIDGLKTEAAVKATLPSAVSTSTLTVAPASALAPSPTALPPLSQCNFCPTCGNKLK